MKTPWLFRNAWAEIKADYANRKALNKAYPPTPPRQLAYSDHKGKKQLQGQAEFHQSWTGARFVVDRPVAPGPSLLGVLLRARNNEPERKVVPNSILRFDPSTGDYWLEKVDRPLAAYGEVLC